ncbi:MAG: 3D-(3,5/4)-trihydroxycyclohexane-1,2-dione acylhydrolase (decyclizing), partial [Clostridia bacterium]|nr:3D-(3,5/4)-trihydroxycyclohexane-1,2-dione acylhydrolase (decyclizing) [Clostridia bacterium]
MKTIKMTMGQALVKFLDNQYVSFDGKEEKLVEGICNVFGHGIVCGIGQALDENRGGLKVYQGKNEQGMAHTATAFARQSNRRKIIACATSIGPGSANMVTAAACASANAIPLLLLPADTFACRQPDPVLQQVEHFGSPTTSTNDAFRAVCRYWDRVSRPEQLMNAMINAMRVLTDPADTGAVCVAIPQDVQGESYDYPESFFAKRVHRIARTLPTVEELNDIVNVILTAKKPLVICGGGVKYSEAGESLVKFCEEFNIPFAETQAGKSACKSSEKYNLGGIGVTGNSSANEIAKQADLVICAGTRLTDFTTASKSLFTNENVKFVSININKFHAEKLDSVYAIGDAKATIDALIPMLKEKGYKSAYTTEIQTAKDGWAKEMERLANYSYGEGFEPLIQARYEGSIDEWAKLFGTDITQTSAICKIREVIPQDAIIIGAAGSLPGDMQRMWTTDSKDAYHMEYGYSCMGYEIAGALGIKYLRPEKEVYAFTGDGSFLMLHSELVTAIQENAKINVLLFDNGGFGCINNLQMSNGIGNLATEFR